MPTVSEIDHLPVPVQGLFAYLNATLRGDILETFSERDVHPDDEAFHVWDSPVRQVADRIKSEFRLMHWGSQLRQALDAFRLYHRDDMASALTCAYSAYRRGGNPLEALKADYCLCPYGVLRWRYAEEVRSSGSDQWLWNQFGSLRREGDRFAGYSLPYSSGTLLVRGDRLVWEVEELHKCIAAVSPRWQAAYDKFNELGGNRAFLAGAFTWPPAGWENPVTDEEEAAGLGKPLRTVKA